MAVSPSVPSVHPDAGFTLGLGGVSPAAISLNWTATADWFFSSYTVELATNANGSWQSEGVIGSQSTTQFSMAGLTPDGSYWWRVVETGWYSTQTSNTVDVTQPSLSVLSDSFVTATTARFNWTNSAQYGGSISFLSYQLFESLDGGAPALLTTITDVSTRTAQVSSLSSGSSYSFFLNTSDCFSACSGGSSGVSSTQSNSVTLGTPLPLVASITAERPVVDTGEAEYLTCTPSGGQSPFNVSWQFGTGAFMSGPPSISHAFGASGPVTVTCKVVDAHNTTSTAATTLSVDAAPTAGILVNRTAADIGQSISFACTASSGDPPYSISLNYGDGNESLVLPGTAVDHGYTGAVRSVPTCLVTDAAAFETAASTSILVSPLPSVGLSIDSRSAAPGTLLAFSGQAANGSGGFGPYNWTFGDGSSAIGLTAGHAFGAAGNFTVTVRAVDSNGVAASRSAVCAITPVQVALSSPPSEIVLGTGVPYRANASGGAGGPFNFTWSFDDGSAAYGPAVMHAYRTSGLHSVHLRVTDRLGAEVYRGVAPTRVTVAPPPGTGIPMWWILLAGVGVGSVSGYGGWTSARPKGEESDGLAAGYVPRTDPRRVVAGMRTCRNCGSTNIAIRRSCHSCGAALPRSGGPKL